MANKKHCPFCGFEDDDVDFLLQHVNLCHPEDPDAPYLAQDVPGHNQNGSHRSEEGTTNWVQCYRCEEICLLGDLEEHLDLHGSEEDSAFDDLDITTEDISLSMTIIDDAASSSSSSSSSSAAEPAEMSSHYPETPAVRHQRRILPQIPLTFPHNYPGGSSVKPAGSTRDSHLEKGMRLAEAETAKTAIAQVLGRTPQRLGVSPPADMFRLQRLMLRSESRAWAISRRGADARLALSNA